MDILLAKPLELEHLRLDGTGQADPSGTGDLVSHGVAQEGAESRLA
jgi:hypothetical protein